MPRYKSMQTYIDAQVHHWQQKKNQINLTEEQMDINLPFLTLSREYGSGGYEVASRITETLNREGRNNTWAAYDKALIEKLMENTGLSSSLIETLTTNARNHLTNFFQTTFSKFSPQVAVYLKLAETIRVLATNGNVVIVGRAGNSITRGMHGGYHVRLVAPMDWRAERMAAILSVQKKEAEKIIREKNDKRMKFIREYVKFDLEDPHNYDMVLNNSKHSSDEAAGIIINAMKTRGLIQ